MYTNVMEKWTWGNMDDVENGIYMDENNRRMVTNIRLQMSNLAETLLKNGDPERAMDVLDELLLATPHENVPYSRVMMPVAETYIQLAADTTVAPNTRGLSSDRRENAWVVAQEVTNHFMDMQEDHIAYFTSLDSEYYLASEREVQFALQIGDRLVRVMKYFHVDAPETKALEDKLTEMESAVEAYERNLMTLSSN